jgi:hypothetical protein
MNIKGLTRDPKLAEKHFVVSKDGVLMTNAACSIMIPKRFVEVKLATVGSENKTVGICAWIVGRSYFITMTNAFIPLKPSSISETDIDGDCYVLYHFDANSVVSPSLDLVKNSGIVYHIFTEIIAKARVPWFINYLDRCKVFDSAPKHAGTNITEQVEVTELIVAHNTRLKSDRSKMFRHAVKTVADLTQKEQVPTSIRTIEYSASSTLTRIAGSYQNRGFIAALNNPSERVEKIEEYLRM